MGSARTGTATSNIDGASNNLAGRISGGQVGLKAALDINNIGGTIDARDKLVLDAGRDINVRTTTGSGSAGNVNIDRVAGLYVSNPGGTLVASAGRDVNLIGAIVANAGSGATAISAKNDINLGTVSTSSTASASGKSISGRVQQSTEVGTRLSGGGSVTLDAGHDVNTGLDYGHVGGPSTQYLLGDHLTGAVVGVRGQWTKWSYDFFVGAPVWKPQGYPTAKMTAGFSLNVSF